MLTALKTKPLLAALCLLAAAPTFAAGEHDHHHGGGEQGQYSFGSPAQATNTARTIRITANDTPRFVAQDPLVIKKGETIQFVITNAGEHRHEFAVGDRASQRATVECATLTRRARSQRCSSAALAPFRRSVSSSLA